MKKQIELTIIFAVLISLSPALPAARTQTGFATESAGDIVHGDYGECVQTSRFRTELATPECGGQLPDSDGDGVLDRDDECPGTPAGVTVDAKGCPRDDDRDGVPNYLDKCPRTPLGVAVDKDGCPLDEDGDGVPNDRDKCPGTPPGRPVDMNGCEIAEKIIFDETEVTLFAFDSAELSAQGRAVMDRVADKLRGASSIETITVVGHTDSIGSEAYNQALSERRAETVGNYLIRKGVPAAKVVTKGMGESKPVTSNMEADGRARNRRVEIKIRAVK